MIADTKGDVKQTIDAIEREHIQVQPSRRFFIIEPEVVELIPFKHSQVSCDVMSNTRKGIQA